MHTIMHVYSWFLFMSADAQAIRQSLRQQMRRYRQSLLPDAQQQAAKALALNVTTASITRQSQVIAVYFTNDAEIDTAPLIHALWQQGKQLVLPVLHLFQPGYLYFQQYTPTTELRSNRFGIAEPVPDVSELVPLAEIDLVLMPLVAFDKAGHRLGMGGGFYDRTLANCPPTTALMGLAHQGQQLAEVPSAAWDVPLPFVATDQQIWQF